MLWSNYRPNCTLYNIGLIVDYRLGETGAQWLTGHSESVAIYRNLHKQIPL